MGTACTPSSPECLTRPEWTWRTFCGVCSRDHPGGRLLTKLTRAEGRRAEPASPRPQTQAEARGRAGRGAHPVLDTHQGTDMEAGLHPRLSRMLPAGKDVQGPQEQPPPEPLLARPPGPSLHGDSSDGHFRPRAGSRPSPHRPPTLPQCPSPPGPGSALRTALGPPLCPNPGAGCWDCTQRGARAGAGSRLLAAGRRARAHLSKRTDTRSIATITDSLSGAAGLGSDVRPGLTFSFPGTVPFRAASL